MKPALTLLTALLLALAAPAAERPNEPQLQAQRDAGERLQLDIAAALKRGDASFTIAPGEYRLAKPWPGSRVNAFRFVGTKGFTLNGGGARIVFESPLDGEPTGGFLFGGCREVTVKDLTLDWDPLPFTQGTIVSTVGDTQEFVFKPDPGYERILGAMRRDDGRLVRIFAFDRATKKLTPYQMRSGVRPVQAGHGVFERAEADGTYRLKLTEGPNGPKPVLTPAQQGMGAGTAVAIVHRWGPVCLWTENCGPMRFENIVTHSAPMGFAIGRFGEGPLVFKGCKAVRPAGSDRFITLNADGINVGKMWHGPIIEDCEMEGVCDDFVNCFSLMFPVFEQPAPDEIITGDFELNGVAQPELRFVTLGECTLLGKRAAGSIERIASYRIGDRWGQGWTLPRPWKTAFAAGKTVRAVRIKLASPLPMPQEGMFFTPESTLNRGAVIRGCRFSTGVARGLLLQGEDFTVEGNRFSNLLESAMLFGAESAWWAGAVNAKRMTIHGNTIEDTNLRAISHSYKGTLDLCIEGDLARADLIEDIAITGNTIIRPGGSAIAIEGARRVRISGNTFIESGNLPWHGWKRQPEKYGVPVAVYVGEEIEQSDNRTERTGPYALEQ
jgi:hypothetical protein